MPLNARPMSVAAAAVVAAVQSDPAPGPLQSMRKGWRGAVTAAGDPERRRVIVEREPNERAELVRVPGAESRPADYPPPLPFVRGAALWWGVLDATTIASWVGVPDTDEVAAGLVAQSLAEGWSADSTLWLAAPFPQVTRLVRGAGSRLVMAQGRQVTLLDAHPTQDTE